MDMTITPIMAVVIGVVALILLFAAGVPIFLSLGFVGIAGCMLIDGFWRGLRVLQTVPFTANFHYMFIVVPLFIFLGYVAFQAGISSDAFLLARKWLSRLPGGLVVSSIVACAFFGAVSGSGVGTATAVGTIAIPEMRSAGYDKRLACGAVAAGGLLAILIPPSLTLVIYGVVTNTSVGALLIGGIIPGIITTVVYSLGIAFLIWRNPKLGPPTRGYPWKERFASLKLGWRVVVLFLVVIGSMYMGIVTPSEAAALGAFVAVVMLVAGRKEVYKRLKAALVDSVRTTGMVFIIMGCTILFNQFLSTAQVPTMAARLITGLDVPPFVVFSLALSIYIPLGMFLDNIPFMLLTLPILHPILCTQMGFDSVWFGILVTKMGMLGMITPPVGLTCYAIAGIARDVPLMDVFRGSAWFIAFELITIGIILAFPALSTWLPSQMM